MQANRMTKPARPFWSDVLPPLTMVLIMVCSLLHWYNVKWGGYLLLLVALPATLLLTGYLLGVRLGSLKLEYKVALGYLLWYLLSRLINGDVLLKHAYFNAAWLCMAVCAALPMAVLMGQARRGQAIALVATLAVAAFTAVALLGIYVAITKQSLQLPFATAPFEMTRGRRLSVWYTHPNITAALLSTGALLALYLALARSGRWRRAAFLLAAAIQYIGVGLTASRTAMLCLAIVLCLIAGRLLYARLTKLGRLPRAALAALAAAAALYVSFSGFNVAIDTLSAISRQLPAQTTEAAQSATTAAKGVVAKREIAPVIDTLGNRMGAYKAAVQYIGNHPLTLLRGNMDDAFISEINDIAQFQYAHMHNAFLQVLMTTGLPGLALMVWFLYLLVRRAARLYFRAKATPADAVLAMLPMVTLAHSMMEPYVFAWAGLINVLFFFGAGVLIQRDMETGGR